jgi:hypothetical protein
MNHGGPVFGGQAADGGVLYPQTVTSGCKRPALNAVRNVLAARVIKRSLHRDHIEGQRTGPFSKFKVVLSLG